MKINKSFIMCVVVFLLPFLGIANAQSQIHELDLSAATDLKLDNETSKVVYEFELSDYGSLTIDLQGKEDESKIEYRVFLTVADTTTAISRDSAYRQSNRRKIEVENIGPGKYWLEIERTGAGGELIVSPSFTAISQAVDNRGHNIPENAVEVEPGKTVSGAIGYSINGAVVRDNYYLIPVAGHGRLVLNLDTKQDLTCQIILTEAQTEARIADDRFVERAGNVAYIANAITEGNYLVRLYANTFGPYSFRPDFVAATYESDSEPNDSVEQATLIELNEETTGLLGYISGRNTDLQDYFKLELTQAGNLSVTIDSQEHLNIQTWLMDANAKNLRADASGNKRSRKLSVNDLQPGTYYLRLRRRAGSGGYIIRPEFIPN